MRVMATLLALLPMQAHALSCMPWGVTDAFLQADAAEEAYVLVMGDLEFDPGKLPKLDLSNRNQSPPLTRVPARFDGQALVRSGADVPFSAPVTLEVACLGPWCAQPQPGPVLAFLRKDGADYVLADNPCGGFVFGAPREEQVQQVRQCLSGAACVPLTERQ